MSLQFPFSAPLAHGQLVPVAEGLWWLRLPLPMRLDHVNAYVARDPQGWTVIDPGLMTPAVTAIWNSVLAGPLAGADVWRVIVTHHHPDHVGMAGWFQARGAALWMPRTGWLYARMLCLDPQAVASPEAQRQWARAGLPPADVAQRAAERPFNFADVVAPLPLGFHRLADGDGLELAGRRWEVRFGQGHAPDHATLWSDDDMVIIGDQVLPGISPNLGVWPTEPDANPVGEYLASLSAVMPHATPSHLVLPGHGLPFRGLPDRITALAVHHHAALDRLEERLRVPATALDCFDALYGRAIGPREWGLALAETLGHLNALCAQGRAVCTPGPVDLWQATR